MLLSLLRHATAEEQSFFKSDAERVLTDKGIKQVKRVANFCMLNNLSPDKLLTSPLIRSLQTATILQQQLASPPLEIVDWLAIYTPLQVVLAEIRKLSEKHQDVWLVGHEPDLSTLISSLMACQEQTITIKKASLTRLELNYDSYPQARLLWSVPCKFMLL